MNDTTPPQPARELEFEYELDAPPHKVWRAISIPALRSQWLPAAALADSEPVWSRREEEVCYRMRDDEPPFLESVVNFQITPLENGGTLLRIAHGLATAQAGQPPRRAANDEGPALMLAA